MNRHLKIPPAAALYFQRRDADLSGAQPFIRQEYVPGRGWRTQTFRKRPSVSWLRKRRAAGVTHVQLSCGGRNADFSVTELLSARGPSS